ncbi:MAG: hypothetical protein JRJ57_00155 [Deltaproteobacteria bacterium]|nr:hypothetical protein [Deltaproteobacteria bacterium]
MDKILQCPNCGSDRFYTKLIAVFNRHGDFEHSFEKLDPMETGEIRCFECDTAVDWIEWK